MTVVVRASFVGDGVFVEGMDTVRDSVTDNCLVQLPPDAVLVGLLELSTLDADTEAVPTEGDTVKDLLISRELELEGV